MAGIRDDLSPAEQERIRRAKALAKQYRNNHSPKRKGRVARFKEKLRGDPARYLAHLEKHRVRAQRHRDKMKSLDPGWCYRTRRTYKLKSQYGLTRTEYEALLDAHGRACAICGGKDRLHVDHSHEDGHVRGILCGRCNPAIGLLGDNIAGLERALRYLQERC